MVFVGYEAGSKAYRVYNPATEKVVITRDAIFEENRPWDWNSPGATSTRTAQGEEVQSVPSAHMVHDTFTVVYTTEEGQEELDTGAGTVVLSPSPAHGTPTSLTTTPSPSSEPCTPAAAGRIRWATPPTHDDAFDADSGAPLRYRRLSCILDEIEGETEHESSEHLLLSAEEPNNIDEALSDTAWKAAMDDELKSIGENKTWEYTSLPAGQKAIGLKWVYKVKRDPEGKIVKHKARLVAKGYSQRQGVDFEEVFAPVARMETVRLLLAMAAHCGWEVHHMDVKSAFLNGDLAEEVYVSQPPGYIAIGKEQQVLKLSKALYGMRQAPRAWYAKLHDTLDKLGFTRSPLEHAVYRRGSSTSFLLVGVYVDDLIITGTEAAAIQEFKSQMQELFKMSDLGLLSYYLGIEVSQAGGEITLCQRSYAAKILEAAGMTSCNSCSTPMECRLKLVKEDGSKAFDATLYRSVIGSLRYLVNTRPDIAHAVGMVSRFMEKPSTNHWAAVKQILRYIQGTKDYGCRYRAGHASPVLLGYSDSDHAGDVGDRKSTSGQVYFLGNNLVTWSSQKQKCVATSSCEAEYIAASNATCQGIWLSRLLGEMEGTEPSMFKLLINNKSAIALAKNPVHHDRSKHIDVKYHSIREHIEKGRVEVAYVRTHDQLADILTKALGRVHFIEMRQKLGVSEFSKEH
jgi:hypothetical protein